MIGEYIVLDHGGVGVQTGPPAVGRELCAGLAEARSSADGGRRVSRREVSPECGVDHWFGGRRDEVHRGVPGRVRCCLVGAVWVLAKEVTVVQKVSSRRRVSRWLVSQGVLGALALGLRRREDLSLSSEQQQMCTYVVKEGGQKSLEGLMVQGDGCEGSFLCREVGDVGGGRERRAASVQRAWGVVVLLSLSGSMENEIIRRPHARRREEVGPYCRCAPPGTWRVCSMGVGEGCCKCGQAASARLIASVRWRDRRRAVCSSSGVVGFTVCAIAVTMEQAVPGVVGVGAGLCRAREIAPFSVRSCSTCCYKKGPLWESLRERIGVRAVALSSQEKMLLGMLAVKPCLATWILWSSWLASTGSGSNK